MRSFFNSIHLVEIESDQKRLQLSSCSAVHVRFAIQSHLIADRLQQSGHSRDDASDENEYRLVACQVLGCGHKCQHCRHGGQNGRWQEQEVMVPYSIVLRS